MICLKAFIKNITNDKGIIPQAVLQNYMLEKLLERISKSQYKDKFILKGGMLIAAMVGIDIRTTMDTGVYFDSMIFFIFFRFKKSFGVRTFISKPL